MVSLEIEQQFAKEATQRMLLGVKADPGQIFGQGSGRAADQSCTSDRNKWAVRILDAKKIVAKAPELQKLVSSGALTIPEAKTLSNLPKRAAF